MAAPQTIDPFSVAGGLTAGAGGLLAGLLPGGPTNVTGSSNSSAMGNSATSSSSDQSFQQLLTNLLTSISQGGGTSSSTTTPNLSPQTQQLIDSLTSKYQTLSAPSLTGYSAQQTQNINKNANLQSQAVDNIMASRGLATSPAAGTAQANVQAGRIGQINQMQEGIPLLQHQLDLGNLATATNFMGQVPHGTTTTGGNTTFQTGTQQQQQGTSGSSNTGQYSATNTNQNTNTNSNQTTQQQGSPAAGIAGLLAGLFSDIRLKKEIKPIDRAVDKIMALRPVSWKWKGGETEDAGLLAQDIQKVLPELIDKTDQSGFLKVNYAGLIGTLVGAIQELKSEVV